MALHPPLAFRNLYCQEDTVKSRAAEFFTFESRACIQEQAKLQGGPKHMLVWAQHIFWPRPFGVVLHAKIDLWEPLGRPEGVKKHMF